MNNADYWRKRFEILENSSHEKADNYLQSIENIYRDAELSVKRDIESFYARFASNNKVSLVDAKKILTAGQLEEFRWSVYDYIKIGEQLNISDEWKRKLENASTRFHISRLEAIKLQIQQQIEVLYANRIDELDNLFKQMLLDNYTRSVFEIQKYLGIGWDFTAINQNKLDLLISKPWTTDNRTFSDRVWTNKINLINDIQKHLIQGLLRGDAPQKIVNAIQGKFNTDKHKISRLVHTETSYFNALSKKQMYSDLEVDRIEIVETLDSRTCDICKSFDGKVIKLSQYEAGVTVPPFHPNCRGTTCPYYDDIQGERIARNQDGEVYYIPSNMTYEEWEKTFVNGGSKNGLINNKNSDIIKVTNIVVGHKGTPKTAQPFSVIEHRTSDGFVDGRTYYGSDGYKEKDIHTTDHGNPKMHPYGNHGEHVDVYKWENGKLISRQKRELNEQERKENADIL